MQEEAIWSNTLDAFEYLPEDILLRAWLSDALGAFVSSI